MSRPIEDYALIGDTRTAALVNRDGSIDWLCAPRFDSGACFAALLGKPEHGRWLITPDGKIKSVRRHYRDATLILETIFETAEGLISVVDFMPFGGQELQRRVDLIRIVKGLKGSVRVHCELLLRFDYGHVIPWVRAHPGGITAIAGPNGIDITTSILLHGKDFKTRASFVVSEGESVPFTLTWYASHEKPPKAGDPEELLAETEARWQRWSKHCKFQGEWRDVVLRSLITLKALTFEPTGGIVAAPTTSLPELIGGERNWDYRYCWLRDATLTLYAFLISGYTQEARDWREWLVRAVAGYPGETQIMYGLSGERLLPEFELSWLPGYEQSTPIRIGNAAHAQLQLDVYGEVLDTLHVGAKYNLELNEYIWDLETALVQFVETAWQSPDHGIWEVRGAPRHFTHSKLMAWVAIDRAIKAIERFKVKGPLAKWRQLREDIHRDVCANGFNTKKNSFVQSYGSTALDAATLMIPLIGFLPATDPRVRSTVVAIERELISDGLVRRYVTETEIDGLHPGEGAFLACSFWLADNYILSGEERKARDLFNRLLDIRNDVGLLSEEYDPLSKRQLGNFPQAFSHVALINTAHNFALAEGPAVCRSTK
jgi:GH15 family glucan-1,4-alpha-glucosidase